MKIGVIGLGDIARKAYLPVITNHDIEIHLCTRNTATLKEVSEHYRITNLHSSLESLIKSGINAAFVHTSTSSHEEIVHQLLENNIHVLVEKPVTYHYASTLKLVELARKKGLVLSAGFNRRFAPAYQQVKDMKGVNMIVMQKNRRSLPGDVRTFIFDDFIHVIDTLLYLFPETKVEMTIHGKKVDNQLHHVTIQLTSSTGAMAIGVMNRDSGTTEERLDVFSPSEKRTVLNVVDRITTVDRAETKIMGNDWESTLFKRGFENMVKTFLKTIESKPDEKSYDDILRTHEFCEQIIEHL